MAGFSFRVPARKIHVKKGNTRRGISIISSFEIVAISLGRAGPANPLQGFLGCLDWPKHPNKPLVDSWGLSLFSIYVSFPD